MISIRIILIRFYYSGSLKRKDIFSACSPATVRKKLRKGNIPLRSFCISIFFTAQNVRLPDVMQRPDFRSKSMIWSPVTDSGTSLPMVNSELPKITPVSRKPPTRTLIVDSMPVGMAP